MDDALARTGSAAWTTAGTRSPTPPRAAFAHMPTAFDHQEPTNKDQQLNTLIRLTTDRRSLRHQGQAAPGSYLNWKRLGLHVQAAAHAGGRDAGHRSVFLKWVSRPPVNCTGGRSPCSLKKTRVLASTAQQAHHLLRRLIGLRHHGGAGLLQDLRPRHVGGFSREIGVHDAAA